MTDARLDDVDALLSRAEHTKDVDTLIRAARLMLELLRELHEPPTEADTSP